MAYIPALHAGYVALFKKYQGADLYVLDTALTALTPRMDRDIRALTPLQALHAIEGLQLFHTVCIVKKETARKVLAHY